MTLLDLIFRPRPREPMLPAYTLDQRERDMQQVLGGCSGSEKVMLLKSGIASLHPMDRAKLARILDREVWAELRP